MRIYKIGVIYRQQHQNYGVKNELITAFKSLKPFQKRVIERRDIRIRDGKRGMGEAILVAVFLRLWHKVSSSTKGRLLCGYVHVVLSYFVFSLRHLQ